LKDFVRDCHFPLLLRRCIPKSFFSFLDPLATFFKFFDVLPSFLSPFPRLQDFPLSGSGFWPADLFRSDHVSLFPYDVAPPPRSIPPLLALIGSINNRRKWNRTCLTIQIYGPFFSRIALPFDPSCISPSLFFCFISPFSRAKRGSLLLTPPPP